MRCSRRPSSLPSLSPGLLVFSHGVKFSVQVRFREPHSDGGRDMMEAIHGDRSPKNRLLLGVEFADGRRCSNIYGQGFARADPSAVDEPLLSHGGGGGGSEGGGHVSLFLSPLPPPGELRLISAWPHRGLRETVTLLPADDIQEAAARVVELWPREPISAHIQRRPEPPEFPAVAEGDWFASDIERARQHWQSLKAMEFW